MAIRYDPWQSGAVQLILGRDEHDRYVATIGGITMSIPRQVGKTFTVGSLLVAMCIEYPGLRVVWTSHHLRTTTNTFRAMQGMVRRKKVVQHLAHNGIRTANGEQEIKFANGSIIMFGAREHGFGVGIDAIDILVCDEAQRLTSRALADMMPTTNQAKHQHGALAFFIGTPPRPDNQGDEFAARRKKAIDGKMVNGIYIEFSADKDADPDDPEQWARANPSYPKRTPHESMLRLRENLTDEGDWLREAMGIWDEELTADRAIPPGGWLATAVTEPPAAGIKSFGVKFAPDGSRVAVVGAMKPDEGPVHVEIVGAHSGSMAAGTASLAAWLAERCRDTAQIVVDGKSHAGAFVNALRDAGVSAKVIWTPTWDQVVTANGLLVDAVTTGTMTHLDSEGQRVLDESALGTTKKFHGDKGAWSWAPISPDHDEIPIAATALALWAAKTSKRKPGRKQRVVV